MPGKPAGGVVFWRGVSQFDGVSPLVVILTRGSSNRKTGDMDQAWILRSDVHPLVATRTGQDAAICGDCRHRGTRDRTERVQGRSCYVTVQHGPAAIYRAFVRGDLYPDVTEDHEAAYRAIAGRYVRFGAYGDPAAVPVEVWASMLPFLKGWTGYTHFWRVCPLPYRAFLMASVDTEIEMVEARARGWRTFRVRHTSARLQPGEIVCPASAEAHHRLTCQTCGICRGQAGTGSTKSVAIYAHGSGKLHFFRSAQAALTFAGES